MAKSKNEVYDDSHCSKSCRKNTENLNTKISKLNEEVSDCGTLLYHYKLGLSLVEARLVEFKTQEIKFCEKIKGLEFDVESKNNKIEYVMNELKQIKKDKEGLDSKLTGFEYALKDLDTLLGSQRTGLPEFTDDTITDYSRPSPSIESNTSDLQNSNSSVSKHKESLESIMSKPMIKFVKAGDSPKIIKTNKVETARKPPVRYAEMYRNTSKSPKVKRKQRNWNNLMNQRLGSNFEFKNKACYEQVNTARPKAMINAVRKNRFNDVKASACWVWKPIKPNSASIILKRYDFVDVRGRSSFVMAWVPKKVVDPTPENNKWKNIENLNTKISKLNEEVSDCGTLLYHYKLGLSLFEARLIEFKTQEIKFCEKIKGLEFDVESKNNKIEYVMNELKQIKKDKQGLDSKLTGYSVVPSPPPAQVYSPPKKDMSWTGLPEFTDDTITDYSRPSPSIESNTSVLQNSNSSVSKHGESFESIMSKPMIKFVEAGDSPKIIKTNKVETARKPPVRYAEMYRNTSKSPKVKGNQRNWNNLMNQRL
nr:hypothetical protein [Tanacetum cinerariifolium]